MVDTKICGIKTPEALTAAIEGGARYVGFVFHPASPRNIDPEIAAYLARYVPTTVRSVGLFVNPEDALLEQVISTVQLDMLQLHGSESPGRIAAIKSKFGLPIIKAIGISYSSDLEKLPGFEAAADMILLDNKAGGSGEAFDWALLEGIKISKPWFLAGGLTPENIAEAIKLLHPPAVDVSSGVESIRGIKDEAKIRAFLKAVKDA